jgi:hypothetical protein
MRSRIIWTMLASGVVLIGVGMMRFRLTAVQALNFLTREVRCAWVHPPSRWGLGAAVNSVAYVAIQAIMCSSGFAAGFYVYRWWRYSVAARGGMPVNEKLSVFESDNARLRGLDQADRLESQRSSP